MRRFATLAAAVWALVSTFPAQAQQDFAKVEVKATRLSDTVYMLTGRGGNLGLSVGPNAAVLVDNQFGKLTDKIAAKIREITDKRVNFVINTHWHPDHTGGNTNFARAGALIVAHDNVRREMISRHFKHLAGQHVPSPSLPIVTFGDDMTLHLNGESVRVFHVAPAHTDGDAIVHFTGSNVLHMGDTFFNGLYTFSDRASGGTFDGMIDALARGLALADDETKIIPGHGPLAGKADLEAHYERMVEIRRRVLDALAAGMTKQAFVESDPTADLRKAYAGSYQVMKPERFLDIVYTDLAARQ